VVGTFFILVKSLTTPSLTSYFFWAGAVYFAVGIYSFLTMDHVHDFLCTIPGKSDVQGRQTVGCGNCTDNLLMCGKASKCWRYAMNTTLQLTLEDAELESVYIKAAEDITCNAIVAVATGPVAMLNNMASGAYAVPPSAACITFHCKVLQVAYFSGWGLSQDIEAESCPLNPFGVKPPEEATSCTCENLQMNTQEAELATATCGDTLGDFSGSVFDKLLVQKPLCFREALRRQAASTSLLRVAFADFKTTQNCTTLTQEASTPTQWFVKLQESQQAAQLAGSEFTVPQYCINVICGVFNATLPGTAQGMPCDWTSNADLLSVTNEDLYNIETYCSATFPSLQAYSTAQLLCSDSTRAAALTNVCPVGITTTTTTTMASTVPTPAPAGGAVVRLLEAETPQWALQTASQAEAAERALQTATPSPTANVANQELEDYVARDWEKCTCYQQCYSGVRTRAVTCPNGVLCREPKPPTAEPCTCTHCADCFVNLTILVFICGLAAQTVFCLTLCLAFLRVSGINEDDWVSVGFLFKLVGFFCKFLPLLIRIVTTLGCGMVIAINVQAFAPGLQRDCKESSALKNMAIVVIFGLVLQLAMGIYMKRNQPMPPALHYATTSSVFSGIFKPLRAIGP